MRSLLTAELRRAMLLVALLVGSSASAAADSVLVLGSTVYDPSGSGNPANSLEAKTAAALGFTVKIVDDSTWQGMTAAQFATYRALILGDPRCKGLAAVSAGIANAAVWGPVVNGNVIIIGTDPVVHPPGGKILTERGVAFAVNQAGKTGAYITLSCYYVGSPLTPVPLLDKAFGSGPGSFQVRGPNNFDDAYITATHPIFAQPPPLTSADLSNWHQSVHESFETWPLDFVVLAIARNFGSSYTAPDGTVGTPYILARGDIKVLSNIELSPPSAINETGTSHTLTATVKDSSGNPLSGITVTFKVLAGPHVGKTVSAVTDASGKATFTYTGTATGTDTIQAQFTKDGKTQTSNLAKKEWVTPSNPCMRILTQKLLCETDSAGKPTGNYTWTFRFQNLSGKPVSHVFLVNPSAGITLDPTHLPFTPAVTSLSPTQTVTIHATAPGTAQFLFSAHDQSLEECCSMKVTLELPPCDCAQMVQEVPPDCFLPFPPPYKYKFNLQNLAPFPMQYLLLAPVSPADLLTPIPPSQLKVTKDVLSFAPIATGGTTGLQTLTLTGGDAAPGKKACLRLGIHDASLDECCSIARCFTLPSCIIDWDDFDSFGDAHISLLSVGFRIEGIGSSGEDGAGIDLPGATSAKVEWLDPDPAGSLPNGAFLEVSATGTDPHEGGEVEGSIRITDVGSRLEVSADIDGSATYRAEVFRGAHLVGTVEDLPARINIIVIWPLAASAEVLPMDQNDGGTLGFRLGTGREVAWELSGGTTLQGDSLLITPEHPDGELESIRNFAIRSADIPSITVTGFSVSLDCNGNGVSDSEDIAAGNSLDVNGDGLPDECQGATGNDLDLALNTGFDQASGTPLPLGSSPGGTSDNDWQVLNAPIPGPAKLVIHPHAAWPAPLANSRWISVDPNSGASIPNLPVLQFENCFCVNGGASSAELDLQLFADDNAAVFLNDAQIGAPGGSFSNASPLHVQVTGAVGGTGPFKIGENCLRVDVRDIGGVVTGLDLTGTVRSANGRCPSGPGT
jgi:hypothetical protein